MSSTQALLAAAVLVALAQSAPAQRQFEELGKRALPLDQDATNAVARGDVDGDGDLDLVCGNGVDNYFGGGRQSRLYLNNGTGTFIDVTAARMPAIGDDTTAVAMGDVDGDGDLDLVLGTRPAFGPSGQNRLYLNNGTGTFADATAARMPFDADGTTCVALGDVDGDGDLDIVFGNDWGQNRLYLNNGTGTFTDVTAARMPVDNDRTNCVAFGDVDSDGDFDLVFGNAYQLNRLYLNNGTGTFTDVTTARMPLVYHLTTCVALGDGDGDGDLDIVFGNGGQNLLYLNNGMGTFTDATVARMPVDGDDTTAVALGDVDGDGDLDLVFGNRPASGTSSQNRLYLNNGTGTFTDATAGRMPAANYAATCVASGDVDGDGDLDLVFGNWSQQNRLYLNNGTGTFTDATAARIHVPFYGGTCGALGDVDGDDDLDLVGGNDGQQNRLYLNNGTGTFTDVTAARMPGAIDSTHAVATGDVDGDGDLDLVFGNNGLNRLYLNNGTGTFTDVTAAHMPVDGDFTTCVALGDVDGDGDLDLVFGNRNQQNRLYLNNGTATFTDATAARMPVASYATSCVALGDVEGDGDLDLVFGNRDNGVGEENRLYLNNGSGTFTDATATRMPLDNDWTNAVALGDVDGDGDLDLVFGNEDSFYGGQNRLYLNNGTGTFIDATGTHMPSYSQDTTCVALGDIDGDGDLDLVLGNIGDQSLHYYMHGQDRLYLNNGTGGFANVTAARMPVDNDAAAGVALGDVDDDGDLDFLIVNRNQQCRLYLNLTRQLDAPFLPRVGHTYQLDVYARYGPPRLVDVAGPFLSTATASIPLPPWGTLGIDPNYAILLPGFVIPPATGVGSVAITVPNIPSLAGISVYGQALLIQYPTQELLTNVTADVVWH